MILFLLILLVNIGQQITFNLQLRKLKLREIKNYPPNQNSCLLNGSYVTGMANVLCTLSLDEMHTSHQCSLEYDL